MEYPMPGLSIPNKGWFRDQSIFDDNFGGNNFGGNNFRGNNFGRNFGVNVFGQGDNNIFGQGGNNIFGAEEYVEYLTCRLLIYYYNYYCLSSYFNLQ